MSRRSRPARSALLLRWASVAILAAIALAYVHPLRAYLHARAQVSARKTDVAELRREKRTLEARLAKANTNQFVLREARMLGLVRPGEHLYIVKGVGKAGLR